MKADEIMEATLDAVERNQRGKNEARRLRATGRIPAVVYGDREGGKAIAVDPKILARILRTEQGANTLIALNLPGGGEARVLVKEYQLDPVTRDLLHADFYRVAMDKLIRLQVTVVAQGEPKGVKQQGGVLDIVHRQIEIECLPADIPTSIEVDVTDMMVGQSIRVRDIATNARWKFLSDPDMMILHVIIPKVEEVPAATDAAAAAAAPAAAAAEPEVIKKGKKDEAEAAEAAPPAAAKKEKK
jgi:large subunit ribosomal protein L25